MAQMRSARAAILLIGSCPGLSKAVAALDDEMTRAQTSHEGLMAKRRFTIVLIKPSHYDDDGYVIQWRRSTIPSNSLASVYGLLAECAEDRSEGRRVGKECRS